MRVKKFVPLLCPLLLLGASPHVFAADAVGIVEEAHGDAAALRQERTALEDEAQRQADIRAARTALTQAEIQLRTALDAEAKALETLRRSEEAVRKAEEALSDATSNVEAAKAALQAAQSAEKEALAELSAAQDAAAAAESEARRADAQVKRVEADHVPAPLTTFEDAKLDALLAQAEETRRRVELASAHAAGKWQTADRLSAAVERVEVRADALTQQREAADEALQEAQDRLLSAGETLRDAGNDKADAALALPEAQKDTLEARTALAEIKSNLSLLENPPPDRHVYYSGSSKYYYAKRSDGQDFYQWLQGYDFSYSSHRVDYGLTSNYVIAGSSLGSRVATFSDTQLSIGHTNKNKDYPVRYTLDVTLPTGKAALSARETNTLIEEDLAPLNNFGEGWQVTPGISISRPIGKEDSWTFGARFNIAWQYQPLSDDPSSVTLPGRQLETFIRWQHLGAKQQTLAELLHVSSSMTQQDRRDYYQEGDEWDFKLVHNRRLSERDNLMLYGRAIYHQADAYAPGIVQNEANTGLHSYATGATWSRALSPTRTLRLNLDYLKRNGSIVTLNLPTAIGNRSKFSYGIGFDWSLPHERSLSLDLQKFWLHTSSVSDAPNYDGIAVQLKFSSAL